MKINKSPVLTTSHYGVNHFFADDDFLNFKAKNNTNLTIACNNQKYDLKELVNSKNRKNSTIIDGIDFVQTDVLPQNNLATEVNNFVKQNSNFAQNITISKNVQTPIVFEFEPQQNLLDTITLTVEKNVKAKVIFKYISNETISHLQTLKIVLKDSASLDFAELFDFSRVKNYVSIEVVCETNSQFNCYVIDKSFVESVQNIKVVQKGDNSKVGVNSIYLAGGSARLSLNFLIEVFGKNCVSNIMANGALKDFAQKNFVGTIDFKQGSQKSVGEEDEICTLLSKTAKSKSTPILLCKEEDVDGKHSSLINKVDDEKLFYIMSRGIAESEAKSILIKAKFSKQVSHIFDEDLKTKVFELLDEFVK